MRYNSVLSVCFSIEHNREDGSDITNEQISRALTLRRRDLDRDGDNAWKEACLPISDTYDNFKETKAS